MDLQLSPRFKREAKGLSDQVYAELSERGDIFRANHFDSRLKTHKLNGPLRGFWAFSVNYSDRVMFEFLPNDVVLFHSVGDHSIYD